MPAANKVLIHRWFDEVWNQKRREAIHELLHPQAILHGLGVPRDKSGPDAFIPFWEKFVSAFPDLKIALEGTLSEEDRVAARCTVRGRHTGPWLGIPPTHAAINFNGICIAEVRDGKLFQGWNVFDFLSFYQQIGLVPPIASP